MSKRTLSFAAPSVGMYKTTAHQLSADEAEEAVRFFTYVEKFVRIKRRSNPIILSGQDIEKIIPSNLAIRPVKNAKLFRGCFYNSAGYSLASKTGLFAAQAILFNNSEAADALAADLTKVFKDHYLVLLRKGNIVGAVNMYDCGQPTKELLELVEFAKQHGFTATVAGTN